MDEPVQSFGAWYADAAVREADSHWLIHAKWFPEFTMPHIVAQGLALSIGWSVTRFNHRLKCLCAARMVICSDEARYTSEGVQVIALVRVETNVMTIIEEGLTPEIIKKQNLESIARVCSLYRTNLERKSLPITRDEIYALVWWWRQCGFNREADLISNFAVQYT